MKDAFGEKVSVQDRVVYVTTIGHKPILNKAVVLQAEDDRIQVQPEARSIDGWRAGGQYPVRWLHESENFMKVSQNV